LLDDEHRGPNAGGLGRDVVGAGDVGLRWGVDLVAEAVDPDVADLDDFFFTVGAGTARAAPAEAAGATGAAEAAPAALARLGLGDAGAVVVVGEVGGVGDARPGACAPGLRFSVVGIFPVAVLFVLVVLLVLLGGFFGGEEVAVGDDEVGEL